MHISEFSMVLMTTRWRCARSEATRPTSVALMTSISVEQIAATTMLKMTMETIISISVKARRKGKRRRLATGDFFSSASHR